MIITSKSRITFMWIVLAILPWVAVIFKDKVMGIAFTFSMRKFIENPAALTFLLTIPAYVSWIIPPVVNFVADRIWTRWGRRKPFIVVSWIGTITCITFMPLAPSFGWLLAAYIAFSIFNDMGGPVESLKMEIVPPAQRGTSQAVFSWVAQVAVLVFWVVAIGRFNEMTSMFGIPISGEQGLFWTVSLGMLVMLLFLTLGIKETNPHSALLGQKFSFRNVFGGLFSNHLWPVYILVFSVGILGTGLGAFNLLLTTEQWGYTNQEMGTNIMVGGIINLMLIPLLGMLANKVGRGKVYVSLVMIGIVLNFTMYLYYNFILYDARPTLIEMIVFGEMMSVTGILTGMALTPFQYDFIPRNELGTFAAGSSLVNRVTGIVTANLMGLFVWGYASLFLGPAGEMVRVTLHEDTPQAQVRSAVSQARWHNPETLEPLTDPKITARPWYATGAVLTHGHGYEIRLRNDFSAAIRTQRDRLEEKRGEYRARRGYFTTQLRSLSGQSTNVTTTAPASAESFAHVGVTTIPGNENAIRVIMLLEPGATTTQAATGPTTAPATAPTTAATTAPTTALLATEVVNSNNVQAFADKVIAQSKIASDNIKRAGQGSPQSKIASVTTSLDAERAGEEVLSAGIKQLDDALEARAKEFRDQIQKNLAPLIMPDGEQVLNSGLQPAVLAMFPLKVRPESDSVEKTLDRMRRADPAIIDMRVVVNGEQVQLAISRNLSGTELAASAAQISTSLQAHALKGLQQAMNWPPALPTVQAAQALEMDLRILEDPLDRHPSPISRVVNAITGVFTDPPAPEQRLNALARNLRRTQADVKIKTPPEAVQTRLNKLLDTPTAQAAATLYAKTMTAAKEQRITIAHPVVEASYAKQQYDYLAGYVGIFVMQLIGLGITFYFLAMVRKGKVRRRGAEEAEAIK
jgi:Na+/melibiose symporter-like transporter